MLHCGGGFVLRHVCVCMPDPFDYCKVGRRAPFHHVIHRGLTQPNGLRLLLRCHTNGRWGCLLIALHVCVCIPLCHMGCWVLSCLLTRLRLVLARASRLLSFLIVGHLNGRMFVVFVLCMSFCMFALGHRCDCPTHQIAQPGTHLHSMTIVYALPDRFA